MLCTVLYLRSVLRCDDARTPMHFTAGGAGQGRVAFAHTGAFKMENGWSKT